MPQGSNVLSGGWRASAGVINVFESYRTGKRSWQISGLRATSDLTPGTLTGYAYCDSKASRSAVASASVEGEDFERVSATADCDGALYQQSGGFRIDDFEAGVHSALMVRNDVAGLSAWKATMIVGSGPTTMTVFNYCLRLQGRRTYFRASRGPEGTVRTNR